MSEEAVSLATLKQTIQKLKENAKIMCFQCEKCGFIDADSKEEFEAMPKEHQKYLLKHRQECGGRFLPFKVVSLEDLEEIVVCVEKLQKQLQKVAKDKFCQDCHEHGRIQACHFCLYEILGEEKP